MLCNSSGGTSRERDGARLGGVIRSAEGLRMREGGG